MSEADIEERKEEDRQALAQAQEADVFEVDEDNWPSLTFFFEVQTQWHYAAAGMGAVRVGMNFTGIESCLRMAGKRRKSWPGLFADLVEIERAVLEADADGREKAR